MNLIGNFTALVTPFNKNYSINHSALKNLCEFQINNFSDGIVALGSTAEAPTLNSCEKHKIMETIVNATQNKIPIIAGINAFSLEEAIYQCEARFLDGADALLISPPPYIKPTQKGLLNFFTTLADRSYIPIIIYNIPSRTGVNIESNTIAQLSKHPNIIGMKDASGDITYTQSIIHKTEEDDFYVLAGNDNQLLPIIALGGSGVISVIGNINPKLMHDIVYLYKNNHTYEAQNQYYNNLNLINALSLESNPICIKYALSKIGLIKNVLRPPLTKISIKNAKLLTKTLETGLITKI